jgi:hypothetical protein
MLFLAANCKNYLTITKSRRSFCEKFTIRMQSLGIKQKQVWHFSAVPIQNNYTYKYRGRFMLQAILGMDFLRPVHRGCGLVFTTFLYKLLSVFSIGLGGEFLVLFSITRLIRRLQLMVLKCLEGEYGICRMKA